MLPCATHFFANTLDNRFIIERKAEQIRYTRPITPRQAVTYPADKGCNSTNPCGIKTLPPTVLLSRLCRKA
jgi:hypothetical protein